MLFSNVLRIAGRTSVKVLSNLFGIEGELYYPKGFKSGKSGYDDEIIYSDTPDWTGKFLAPFIFETSEQHFGGFYDELNGSEKAIFFDDKMIIPINSLIVLKMKEGDQMYKVYDLQSNNDELGHIYTKAIVVPVLKNNIHTKHTDSLNNQYVKEMIEKNIDIDNSMEEFLNDLLGESMKDMKNNESKTIKTNKKVSDSSIISISDEDLL